MEMETLGALLQPHSQYLQQLVIVLSCVKLLRSLKIVCLLKMRTGSDGLAMKSLLGALILAVLGMRLAHLRGNPMMMIINSTSLMVNVAFLTIVYGYASPEYKSCICRKLLLIVMLIVLCLCYSVIANPETVQCFLSLGRTLTTSLLIVMGLLKGTDGGLGCFMSMLLAASKLLYALSMLNTFMFYQSFFVLCLNLLRIWSIALLNPRRGGFYVYGILSKHFLQHSSRIGPSGSSDMGLRNRSTVGLSTVKLRNSTTLGLRS